MKCLETEKLISYAYHLTDEPAASEVRAHLGECPRCREIVIQHARLDTLLDEWKAAEPTPWFDARVRQAVETRQAGRERWVLWGLDWAHGLVLASLSVLIIAGMVWFSRSHRGVSKLSGDATREAPRAMVPQTPAQMANPQSPSIMANVGVRPDQAAPKLKSVGAFSNDDKDAQALEDYDLAANFDLLSELPRGGRRVAN